MAAATSSALVAIIQVKILSISTELLLVQFNKSFKRLEGTSTQQGSARLFQARFDALVSTNGVNTEGGIDKHGVALERCGATIV